MLNGEATRVCCTRWCEMTGFAVRQKDDLMRLWRIWDSLEDSSNGKHAHSHSQRSQRLERIFFTSSNEVSKGFGKWLACFEAIMVHSLDPQRRECIHLNLLATSCERFRLLGKMSMAIVSYQSFLRDGIFMRDEANQCSKISEIEQHT